jgi:hypothetical protein
VALSVNFSLSKGRPRHGRCEAVCVIVSSRIFMFQPYFHFEKKT